MLDRMTICGVSLLLTFCGASAAFQSYLAKDATEIAIKHCAETNMVSGAYRICLDQVSLASKAY
jgi:hypothetical protein